MAVLQDDRPAPAPGGETSRWAAAMWSGGYLMWYVGGATGVRYVDPGEPESLRWWASRLFLIGGVLATLGTAAEFSSWLMAVPVLLAFVAASAVVVRRERLAF